MLLAKKILFITIVFSNGDSSKFEISDQYFIQFTESKFKKNSDTINFVACFSLSKESWLITKLVEGEWHKEITNHTKNSDEVSRGMAEIYKSEAVDFSKNSIKAAKIEIVSPVPMVTYYITVPELSNLNRSIIEKISNKYIPNVMHTHTYLYEDNGEIAEPVSLKIEMHSDFSESTHNLFDLETFVFKNN